MNQFQKLAGVLEKSRDQYVKERNNEFKAKGYNIASEGSVHYRRKELVCMALESVIDALREEDTSLVYVIDKITGHMSRVGSGFHEPDVRRATLEELGRLIQFIQVFTQMPADSSPITPEFVLAELGKFGIEGKHGESLENSFLIQVDNRHTKSGFAIDCDVLTGKCDLFVDNGRVNTFDSIKTLAIGLATVFGVLEVKK